MFPGDLPLIPGRSGRKRVITAVVSLLPAPEHTLDLETQMLKNATNMENQFLGERSGCEPALRSLQEAEISL